jgi:hypothetical protein
MENEKKNLDKHFLERTVSMLKNIENLENSNIRNKIRHIVEDAVKNVLNVIYN